MIKYSRYDRRKFYICGRRPSGLQIKNPHTSGSVSFKHFKMSLVKTCKEPTTKFNSDSSVCCVTEEGSPRTVFFYERIRKSHNIQCWIWLADCHVEQHRWLFAVISGLLLWATWYVYAFPPPLKLSITPWLALAKGMWVGMLLLETVKSVHNLPPPLLAPPSMSQVVGILCSWMRMA